jgi:hypothetical protein
LTLKQLTRGAGLSNLTIKVGSLLRTKCLVKDLILLNAQNKQYGASNVDLNLSHEIWELFNADNYLSPERVKQLQAERS